MSVKLEIDQDTSDDSISSSSSSSSSGIPFKKPCFQDKWLQDPRMSSWLRKQEDGRIWCAVCETHLNIYNGKFGLKKHANTLHHKMNIHKKMEGAGTSSALEVSKNEIKEVEIRYCLFVVERSVSFETFQALNKLNQFIGSKIPLMQSIRLGKTKMRAIIRNVINKSIILDLKEIAQEKYFSIIIDESPDISDIKNLSILIRFINNKHLETHLLDLIAVKEATTENIFKCIMNSLNKFDLYISKIVGVGVGVDNANVVIGCNNSLMTTYMESNSEIITFACLCDSMHLVATHASKCIPDFINEMLQDIYKYFSHSPKRAALLHDIQKLMRLQKQKVLRSSKTRWLARVDCIERILNQWVTLYTLFTEENLNDNLNENSIYSLFTDDFTKPYLEFLNCILKQFDHFNILFQSNKILIHTISEECKAFIRVLASHFIKKEFLKDGNFEKLNVNDPNMLLPLDNIFIGSKTTKLINNLKESKPEISNKITEFYKNIQKFYKIAYIESIKRLPYNNRFVEALNFLNPQVALNYNKHVGQIEIIIKKFSSHVIGTKVIDQWFLLATKPSEDEKEKLKTLDVIEFWSTVSNLRDKSGNLLYNEVGKLAYICLSLPHSNADVERCLSMITNVKNKKRTNLSTQMVCALTRIKLYLQSNHIDACSFKISDQLLQCFNSEMYNRDKIPSELNGVLLPDETEDSSSDSDVS